jgi:hypothetical protein
VNVLRARSVGNWSEAGLIDEVPAGRSSATLSRGRANSVADPLELANANDLPSAQFRRGHPQQIPSGAVPFPSMTSPNVGLPNPFEIPPPAPEHFSHLYPKTLAHQRTLSFASLNSLKVLDVPDVPDLQQERQHHFSDGGSVMTGAFQREAPARYSRIES